MGNSRVLTGQLSDHKGMTLDIKEGWQVCIMMTTQSYFNQRVILKNQYGRIFFEQIRGRNKPMEPVFSQVIRNFAFAQPTLLIDVPESSRVDCRFSEVKIDNDKGEYVAVSYTFMVEDSTDYDYNDLLLHITAYRNVG
ncbi:hypothetical protein [Candidatus Stoquefichus massiliensis]|uniref:hypothetical protein n=1 Tax=Candidatus Stoquefichus massiliensis TaxID=1470350 RepID=UPI000484C132|nr:hypothetical protein [Candidatus Stoquefichus massiliensis]